MPEKLFECLLRMDDDAVVNICDKDITIRITDTFREMKVLMQETLHSSS